MRRPAAMLLRVASALLHWPLGVVEFSFERIGTPTGGFTSDSVQCDNSRGEFEATLLR